MRKWTKQSNFLTLLLARNQKIYISGVEPGKRSGWFTDLEMAAKYIRKNNEDVYIRVSLSKENRGIPTL